MAEEGLVFTRHYAGAPVSGPSRACLMTGLHNGHGFIKGNPGGIDEKETLREEDLTIAEVLQKSGYETACIGKWGLGKLNSTGYPTNKGFDYFIGYDTHVSAHNYYPKSMCKNDKKFRLDGQTYSHDIFTKEALSFISKERKKPFFLYLAYTIPHSPYNPPDLGIYKKMNWPDKYKKYASMISRMDADVLKILELLKNQGIAENTLVIFTSDNGPQSDYCEGENELTAFFDCNGPLRGIKRDVLEGGIRIPYIAWWPKTIKPGITDIVTAFQDFFPTACEIAREKVPKYLDGHSMLSIFKGDTNEFVQHDFLYWEFMPMGTTIQGSRQGLLDVKRNLKAIRYGTSGKIQIYSLDENIYEEHNIADESRSLSIKYKNYMDTVRTESELWPISVNGWLPINDD